MSRSARIAVAVVAAVLVAIAVFTVVDGRVHRGQCWNPETSRWVQCSRRDG